MCDPQTLGGNGRASPAVMNSAMQAFGRSGSLLPSNYGQPTRTDRQLTQPPVSGDTQLIPSPALPPGVAMSPASPTQRSFAPEGWTQSSNPNGTNYVSPSHPLADVGGGAGNPVYDQRYPAPDPGPPSLDNRYSDRDGAPPGLPLRPQPPGGPFNWPSEADWQKAMRARGDARNRELFGEGFVQDPNMTPGGRKRNRGRFTDTGRGPLDGRTGLPIPYEVSGAPRIAPRQQGRPDSDYYDRDIVPPGIDLSNDMIIDPNAVFDEQLRKWVLPPPLVQR